MVKDITPCRDDELEEGEEQRELFEHFHIDVDKGQSTIRIDRFITTKIQNVSRSRVQSAADAGNVLVMVRRLNHLIK